MIYLQILPELSQIRSLPVRVVIGDLKLTYSRLYLYFLIIAFLKPKEKEEYITLETTTKEIRESFTQNHHRMKAWLLVISF